jgi:hypothetical protein
MVVKLIGSFDTEFQHLMHVWYVERLQEPLKLVVSSGIFTCGRGWGRHTNNALLKGGRLVNVT